MALIASVEGNGLNPMSFTDQHGTSVLERLRYQRETGRFCDVFITVKDRRFTAHRNILAACSPYFDSIFQYGKITKEHVTVNCPNPVAFELFLNYMYSGNIVIDRSSVTELLKLANNFLVTKLKGYCCEYLDRYLDVANVISIKQLASKYNLPVLLKTACEFFDANINRCVLESIDIPQYTISQLTKLLDDPKYANVILPDVHLKLIVRWISDDIEKRESHFRQLLAGVQLTSCSEQAIEFLLDYAQLFSRSMPSRLLIMQQLSRSGILPAKYQEQYTNLLANTSIPEPRPITGNDNDVDMDELEDEEGYSDLDDEEGSLYGSEDDSMDAPVEGHPTTDQILSGAPYVAETSGTKLRLRLSLGKDRDDLATSGSDGDEARNRLLHKIRKHKGFKRRGRPPKRITDDDVDIPAFDEDELDGVYADGSILTGMVTYTEDDLLDPDSVDDGEEVSDPSGSNPCPYCRFASNSEEETARHCARKHNRNTIFVCQMCDFECKWSKNFYDHVRQNHFHMPPFNCGHCAFESNDRLQDILAHMLIHSEIRFFKCAHCGFRGRTRTQVWAHEKLHADEAALHCIECGRSFNQQSALDSHMSTHSDARPHICDECGFSSKSADHILTHKKGHNGDVFYCHIEGCDYSSPKKSQLAAHLRTHLAVRAHTCKICNRGFIEKSHLVRHERIHLDEKPFKCDICDYASSRRDKLKEHILKHHNGNQASRSHRRRYKRERQLAALAAQEEAEMKLGVSENVFRPIGTSEQVEQWQTAHGHHFQQGSFSPLGRSTSVCIGGATAPTGLSPGSMSLSNINIAGTDTPTIMTTNNVMTTFQSAQIVPRSPHNHSENYGVTTPTDLVNRAMSVPPYSQHQGLQGNQNLNEQSVFPTADNFSSQFNAGGQNQQWW